MPKLTAQERAKLPDSAFAYVDSTGKRRLPIHDAAHVRNALARFDQVAFDDEAARDRARTRLLRAAHKHGVAPIGFIRAEIQPQRRFPKGNVTFLLTDVEASTSLLARLGDAYRPLLTELRRLVRAAVRRAGGQEVDSRGDEMLAVFREPADALEAALAIQSGVGERSWSADGADVRLRVGVHSGRPTLTETGYIGLALHATARVCFAAHGGQILTTSAVRSGLGDGHGVSLKPLGSWHFHSLPKPSCSRLMHRLNPRHIRLLAAQHALARADRPRNVERASASRTATSSVHSQLPLTVRDAQGARGTPRA